MDDKGYKERSVRRGGIELITLSLPVRKKSCLCVKQNNDIIKLGQFDNQNTEDAFWNILDYIFMGNNEDKARDSIEKLLK